jgi:uncharacterized RDD family membrane protein YckC
MAKPATPEQGWTATNSRAAQAAARVAARYAQAPSYSQMQAAEAHAALRAAGAATQAALEANAAAQAALAGLQAAPAAPHQWEPEAPRAMASAPPSAREWEPSAAPVQLAVPASLEAWESQFSHTRWEPDLRLLPLEPVSAAAAAPRLAEGFASSAEDGWEKSALSPALAEEPWDVHDLEPVEPDLPIHANLIEFPRELVATRKMRPRRIEGPFVAEGEGRQLSIFEVDPDAISTEPETAGAAPASAWPEPEWSGIELEAQPPTDEPEQADEPAPELAPELGSVGRRLTAALVDGVFIAGACLALALAAASKIGHPAARIVELGAVSALVLIGLIYQAVFLILAGTTPGMRCARISLCTFDGQIPTPAQLRRRLGALVLSVLPLGLGIAWVLFDEDRLCWHDRLSRTYLRKY